MEQINKNNDLRENLSGTTPHHVPDRNTNKLLINNGCSTVPLREADSGHGEGVSEYVSKYMSEDIEDIEERLAIQKFDG